MSDGPIAAWWRSHKPDQVSTPDAHRICAPNIDTGRAYCGRSNRRTDEWAAVTCRDCWAARHADEAVKR